MPPRSVGGSLSRASNPGTSVTERSSTLPGTRVSPRLLSTIAPACTGFGISVAPFASAAAPGISVAPFASSAAPGINVAPFASSAAPGIKVAPFASSAAPGIRDGGRGARSAVATAAGRGAGGLGCAEALGCRVPPLASWAAPGSSDGGVGSVAGPRDSNSGGTLRRKVVSSPGSSSPVEPGAIPVTSLNSRRKLLALAKRASR